MCWAWRGRWAGTSSHQDGGLKLRAGLHSLSHLREHHGVGDHVGKGSGGEYNPATPAVTDAAPPCCGEGAEDARDEQNLGNWVRICISFDDERRRENATHPRYSSS